MNTTINDFKLELGQRIKVHGFLMLEGLKDNNIYEVTRRDKYKPINQYTYWLHKVNKNGSLSKKTSEIIRHRIHDVNRFLNHSSECNYIEIIENYREKEALKVLNKITNNQFNTFKEYDDNYLILSGAFDKWHKNYDKITNNTPNKVLFFAKDLKDHVFIQSFGYNMDRLNNIKKYACMCDSIVYNEYRQKTINTNPYLFIIPQDKIEFINKELLEEIY